MRNKKEYFNRCPFCKGRLDPEEHCDCKQSSIAYGTYRDKTPFEKITKEAPCGQMELETEKLCYV